MKATEVLNKVFSGFLVLALAVFISCAPGRDGTRDRGEARGTETTEETIEALDTRIRDLNRELASVERDFREGERSDDAEESWSAIEQRRQDLNMHIERYNTAIQREAELEAAQIRGEIDRQLNELEREVNEFRKDHGREMRRDDNERNRRNLDN
jgi:archaellum component FlaC